MYHQNCSNSHPYQIRWLDPCHSFAIRIDDNHRSYNRHKNQNNINHSQKIILKTKLDWCEEQIEDDIEYKRQSDMVGYLLVPSLVADNRQSDENDRIQDWSHSPVDIGLWSSIWFADRLISLIGVCRRHDTLFDKEYFLILSMHYLDCQSDVVSHFMPESLFLRYNKVCFWCEWELHKTISFLLPIHPL